MHSYTNIYSQLSSASGLCDRLVETWFVHALSRCLQASTLYIHKACFQQFDLHDGMHANRAEDVKYDNFVKFMRFVPTVSITTKDFHEFPQDSTVCFYTHNGSCYPCVKFYHDYIAPHNKSVDASLYNFLHHLKQPLMTFDTLALQRESSYFVASSFDHTQQIHWAASEKNR